MPVKLRCSMCGALGIWHEQFLAGEILVCEKDKHQDDNTENIDVDDSLLETTLLKLRREFYNEINQINQDPEHLKKSTEARLKSLGGYLKSIFGIEEMLTNTREKSVNGPNKHMDVVEFRRQLEMQIERLVDEETTPALSGSAE